MRILAAAHADYLRRLSVAKSQGYLNRQSEALQIMATATKKKPSSTGVKIQPLGDRVVIRRDESEETTAGGIVLPDSAQDKPARGRVVSVGDGKLLDDGTRGEMQIKAGDRVLFSSYAGESIELGDEEYLLMAEENILAVVE